MTVPLVDKAIEKLEKFVADVEELYGLRNLTYNTHQLLHLGKSVKNWGPLWAHSTFPFEAANGSLTKAIHCARGVILQIIKFLNIQRTILKMQAEIYADEPSITIQLYEKFKSKKAKKTEKVNSNTYFGQGKPVKESLITNFEVPKETLMFSKIVSDGCLYATSEKVNVRSCNYFAQLKSKKFIKIRHFLLNPTTKEEWIICQPLHTKSHKYSEFIFEINKVGSTKKIKTTDIKLSSIFIEVNKKNYVIAAPKSLQYK